MRKYFIVCMMIALIILCCPLMSFAADINMSIDGTAVVFNDQPFIYNGRTMLPLRDSANALGLSVSWDNSSRTAVFSKTYASYLDCPYGYKDSDGSFTKTLTVSFTADTCSYTTKSDFTTYETTSYTDSPTLIRNGRTYAPIRFLAETYGYDVSWDQNTKTVILKKETSGTAYYTNGMHLYYPEKATIASEDTVVAAITEMHNHGDYEIKIINQGYANEEVYVQSALKKYKNSTVENSGYILQYKSTYDGKNTETYLKLSAKSGLSLDDVPASKKEATKRLTQLYASKTLTHDMSETQRANIIANYISGICVYKNIDQFSHTALSVFNRGNAVCQGYVAAYNLMLKLDGIKCYGEISKSGEHIWTKSILDGKTLYTDIIYKAINVSSAQMLKLHKFS